MANEPMGVWDGDALLTVQGASSAAPVLHVQDDSGREIQEITINVTGADLTHVPSSGVARTQDGYLAVIGSSYSQGRGAGFLDIIAPDGSKQAFVRTEPFVPHAVTFASDGTVWIAGFERGTSGSEIPASNTYFVLRRFDKRGRFLSGVMPRTALPGPLTPSNGSILISSPDRIGWLSPAAGRYLEFSLDGKQVTNEPVPLSFANTYGIAICPDDSVWVSVRTGDVSEIQSLDRDPGQLVPRLSPGHFVHVYGCTADGLVTSSDWSQLNWIALP